MVAEWARLLPCRDPEVNLRIVNCTTGRENGEIIWNMFKYLLVGMYRYSVLPVMKRAMCMCQSRCVMKIMKNDEAVSPVIGVILMVAITVILAAVIAAFVFGLAGTTQTTRTVGLQLSLNSTDNQSFVLQFTGGSDLPSLASFSVNRDGATVTLDNTTVNSPTGNLNFDNNKVKPGTANDGKFVVGQIINIDTKATVSGHKITIIGTFTDGGTQILWDRTL